VRLHNITSFNNKYFTNVCILSKGNSGFHFLCRPVDTSRQKEQRYQALVLYTTLRHGRFLCVKLQLLSPGKSALPKEQRHPLLCCCCFFHFCMCICFPVTVAFFCRILPGTSLLLPWFLLRALDVVCTWHLDLSSHPKN